MSRAADDEERKRCFNHLCDTQSRLPQLLGADNCWEAVLYTVGCVAVSLAPGSWSPDASKLPSPPPAVTTKCLQTLQMSPCGAKSPPVDNRCQNEFSILNLQFFVEAM